MMGKKPPGVLVFLLVLLKVLRTAEADCSSTCSPSCDCSSLGLRSVPQYLPTTITELNLQSNQITTLSQSDFSRYRLLETLNLHYNRISTINNQAFSHLSNLKRLMLFSGRLTVLRPGMFTGLGNLEDLYLSFNRITDIQAGTFNPTSQLKFLHLYNNGFTSLRTHMFIGLGNLTYLNLYINHISDIETGTFNSTPQLRSLNLEFNNLANLRADMFTGLGNLERLVLEDNSIETIPAGTFNLLPQLTHLTLDSNKLTNLTAEMFIGIENLQHLDLENNIINDIQAGTFFLTPQLRTLWMYGNKLTTLNSNMFTGLGNLQELTLSNNEITDIHAETFNPISQLKNLALTNNNITIFPFNELSRVQSISYLSLLNNQMESLPFAAYDVLSSISNVHIDNNPWHCDCRMLRFRLRMVGYYSFYNQIICSQLSNFHGQKLKDISPEHLMSDCEEPTIVRFVRSDNMTLYHGETLNLVCEATGIPTPDITVTLPSGLHATVESVGRVTVSMNGTITITNINAEDAGLYTCTAASLVGSRSATLSIDIAFEEPTIVRFERSKNDTSTQGEMLHLFCEATGIPAPEISVVLPSGLDATADLDGRVTVSINGLTVTVTITEVSAAHAGLYACTAASPVGSTNAILIVDVTYEEPTIVRFEQSDKNPLIEGETLLLICEASGIPTPDITVILPSGLNVTVESVGRVTVNANGTVIVRDITAADAGLYICIAANSIGSKFATLYVDIDHKVTTVTTATSSVAITSYKPETNNYHATAPSFSLPVLLGAICGSIAGTVIIGGIILAIWCKRNNQNPPKGPDFSVVFNNTNTTTTVITNGHDLTGQTQSSNIRNPQLVPRPASSQFQPYEDVQPPPGGAVPRQPARRQALQPPNRSNNEPPPVPPPRTASATGYENIPEHAYQPLTTTRNQPDNGQDSSHHYQSLRRT